MSTTYERRAEFGLRHELAALQGNWLWFVLLGIGLIILGIIALGSPWSTTLATAVVIGSLLVVGGVFEIVGTFWSWRWSGFFFHLLTGVLSIVVGLLFLRAPDRAVLTLTLLLACLLTVSGIFTIITAVTFRFGAWGWPLVSGIIDLILGIMIGLAWPESAMWVIGLFVGISLIFHGVDWIGVGAALRTLPRSRTI
jgi:uncharacterized membrane protein HdeD (DUF308 family)